MNLPRLRQWNDSDLAPLAAMNADPEVMRYLLTPVTRAQPEEMLLRSRKGIEERGWGVWAVEVDREFAGKVGLHVPTYPLPLSPCTEVLWRLPREFWERGIAFAAASEAVERGFSQVGLDEIAAFTTPANLRSIRLMERLGLTRDLEGDFDHPLVPEGHPPRRHILFRKAKPRRPSCGWRRQPDLLPGSAKEVEASQSPPIVPKISRCPAKAVRLAGGNRPMNSTGLIATGQGGRG